MIINAEEIASRINSKGSDPFVVNPQPDLKVLQDSGSASIDLRLGTWFVTMRQSKISLLDITNPKMKFSEAHFTKSYYVPFGEKFILHPRNFVLGVTLEWVRFPSNLAGYVVGRSSWGRRGLIIATAAGVHPGFTGCLTLELTNVGEIPIAIEPGMTICQLFLHGVSTQSKKIDKSIFAGKRKPTVGNIQLDDIALKLSKNRTR